MFWPGNFEPVSNSDMSQKYFATMHEYIPDQGSMGIIPFQFFGGMVHEKEHSLQQSPLGGTKLQPET